MQIAICLIEIGIHNKIYISFCKQNIYPVIGKFIGSIWGVIVGIGVVISIIVGSLELADRLSKNKSNKSESTHKEESSISNENYQNTDSIND